MTYEATTRDIQVTVVPHFLEEQSNPEAQHYVWAYTVHITNLGQDTVQLLNRFWRIADAHGYIEEVRGPGVVGEQPVLPPGEVFQYTSGAPLKTASGIMLGTYEMQNQAGEKFDITIPAFSLDSPHQAIHLN